MSKKHFSETHKSQRSGWLRAAVLGANDGILSTAGLIVGVAAARSSQSEIFLSGLAGVVAGAMSMAAGEYISVSSQADAERADLAIERKELASDHEAELEELAKIYVGRGLQNDLARQVAEQLMEHDALGAHARDELGISPRNRARPLQAAGASALTFTIGGALPMAVIFLSPPEEISFSVAGASLLGLGILGALAARTGGAKILPGTVRVVFWGTLAMAATAMIGHFFSVPVN